MAEWSKARDSKSRRPQKGLEGSNPSLSAIGEFALCPSPQAMDEAEDPVSP